MQLRDSFGNLVDMTTGEVVGRDESVPANVDPRSAARPDLPVSGALDRVTGVVNQASWGFNSALFALPDLATKGIGKALGLQDEEVTTLSKIFNRGETAPRDRTERYARALLEGVGATLPFTGILAWAARARPMVQAATPSAGILKGTADDIIKYVQKNPGTAAAIDIAFSAGYEGLRQAVEETVDDSNENKQIYKELLPAAAFIGAPLLLSLSPTAFAARKLQQLGDVGSLDAAEQEALRGAGKLYQLPVMRILPKYLIKNAKQKLETVFGEIEKSPQSIEAIEELRKALLDPRIAEQGFMFGMAETTKDAALIARKASAMATMPYKERVAVIQQQNENVAKLDQLFDSFAPEARLQVEDAFRAIQAERQQFFDGLITQGRNLTDGEKLRLNETFGPANPDMINDELRGMLYAGMEMDAQMRQNILSRMGLRQAVSPEGLPMPTRSEGKSLFPATSMEEAALRLIEKYRIERPTMRSAVPEPIRLLEGFIASQQAARAKLENKMVEQLVRQEIADQLGDFVKGLPEDIVKAVRSEAMAAVRGQKDKSTGRFIPSSETQTIITGVPGRNVFLNPAKIHERASVIAKSETEVDINLPEGLDYLESAMRFRNDSLMKYNNALKRGRSRITDAQRYLDTGDAVFKDMEQLVLGHVPRIRSEYTGLRTVLDDYRSVYEDTLPLLTLSRGPRAGADKFLVPNEQVLQTAFRSADNVRSLSAMIGNDPRGRDLLERGTLDWLRSKNVFDKDGLIDPAKIRSVLDKNSNIVQALPANVRNRLQNEVDAADLFVKRAGELEARRIQAADAELDKMLAQATRPDAPPAQSLEKAMRDPASMRKLVDTFGKDPEMLGALRRSVYYLAVDSARGGGSLQAFMRNNERSLRILFKDTKHFDDMLKLADLHTRTNLFTDITGQLPAYDSLDENLKGLTGSSVRYFTTQYREISSGRVSLEGGLTGLFMRLASNTETSLYDKLFLKALEDKNYAKALTSLETPQDGKKLLKALEQAGIYWPSTRKVTYATQLELADELKDQEPVPAERPRPQSNIARQMLKALPPAPPVRGVPQAPQAPQGGRTPLLPTSPQVPARQQVELMYPQMFPNDPISGMLQQRQQQLQQPQR
jgi:hypothetical protein